MNSRGDLRFTGPAAAVAAALPAISFLSRVTSSYAPEADAVRLARGLTVYACRTWRLTEPTAGIAELVAAELVGNAVRHARTRIDLTVSRSPRRLHIAVRDYVSARARLTGPADDAGGEPGGRGLLIVDAVTTHWGCTPVDGPAGPGIGKVTWAALATGAATTRTA